MLTATYQARQKMNQFYLTQFNEGCTYVKSQILDLARAMGDNIEELNGGRPYVTNEIVGFEFILTKLSDKEGCDNHYYRLAVKSKFLGAIVGAKVIMSSNGIDDVFSQGDVAVLTRNEGASGWWAKFENGCEWNVGSGYDFIVIDSGMNKVKVLKEASDNINAMSPEVKNRFTDAVIKFQREMSPNEKLAIGNWLSDIIYFKVVDSSKEHPSTTRFLLTFNCETGEFCTGNYKKVAVQSGWERFAESVLGQKVSLLPS